MSTSVARVITSHQSQLVKYEVQAVRQQTQHQAAVATALVSQTRTTAPPASNAVLSPVRKWRTEARETYSDLKGLEKGTSNRSLAMTTYAQLDNALFYLVKALKAGPDAGDSAQKAKGYMTSYRRNLSKLNGALR